ncbi:MAG: hypothetical protein JWN95_3839 [Frankiales bacterium]|nr:hypothetical protein [Frankiales bacterium]
MSTNNLKQKLRQRRAVRQFERVLESASPAMRSDLLAAAARQDVSR